MSSNWQAYADKFVHDLENKGYELVDKAASVAEEVLEAVVSVVEEASERITEAKASAEAKHGTTFADLWKEFTDTVEPQAPVAEEDLSSKAKRAYFYLTEVNSDYKREYNVRDDYWEDYYLNGSLATAGMYEKLIREAGYHGFKG